MPVDGGNGLKTVNDLKKYFSPNIGIIGKGVDMKIDPEGMARQDFYHMLLAALNPRPIAWVSTVGEDGVYNLAPFSFFSAVSAKPAVICLSVASKRDGQKKDTLRNIESGMDFVLNTVNGDLAEAMNQTSAEYPPEVDEFQEVGLTPLESDMVKKLVTPKHVIELTEKEVTLTYLALKDFRQKLMKNEEDAGPSLDDAHVVDSLMTKLDSLPELETKFVDE